MNNAVIYARYSSHAQNEQTIEGQIRVCTEYAEKLNLKVIKTYIDKHKTGTDVNRPQFQQMISDAKTGAFSYVIVYMLDRFARNRYYSTIYSFQLSQNGVQVISAMENISESEEGELYRLFLEWNAEQYSKRLSKRVLAGITTSVNNGTFTGGHLPFGYKVVNKKVLLHEQESEIVKQIFKAYANGKSKKQIADELNKKGLNYKGKPFTIKSFEYMLNNAKYTGDFLLGGRKCLNMFPQIIDKKLFEQVQQQLAKNKLNGGANSAKTQYLLQGKIYCGHCGEKMIADGGTSHSKKQYHYYVCKNRKKQNTCNKSNEEKETLELDIVKKTIAYLSDEKNQQFIANKLLDYYNQRTSLTTIEELKRKITNINAEINNAIVGMTQTSNRLVFTKLDERVQELSVQLNDLENYKEQLESEQKLNLNANKLIDFMKKYIKGNPLDKAFQKRLIDNLINCVYIYDDKIIVYFNVSGKECVFINKSNTDNNVQSLTRSVSQYGKCLNTDKIYHIFVNGVFGIVTFRKPRK